MVVEGRTLTVGDGGDTEYFNCQVVVSKLTVINCLNYQMEVERTSTVMCESTLPIVMSGA